MALSESRQAELIAYCREDPTDQLKVDEITGFYESVVGYLEGACVPEPAESSRRWNVWWMVVKGLVLDLDEKRGATVEAVMAENITLRRMLNQLKVTG